MHSGDAVPTRFVILAAPRTGSNMLCTLLNSHPAILCHHELFNPEDIFYALPLRDGSFNLGTIEERDSDPLSFLDRAWRNYLGHECIGFKLTHRQNEAIFYEVLGDRGVKKIILRRKNPIKTFVSFLIAEKTGRWEVYAETGRGEARNAECGVRSGGGAESGPAQIQRVSVDLEALRQHIAFNHAYYGEIEDYLDGSRQPFLRALYERLFFDEERLGLLEFLGVAPDISELKVESVKQNRYHLRDLISNFSELEKGLKGSELESDLYC